MPVTRFPINSDKRRKNSLGKYAVPCQVTDRFIRFHEESVGPSGARELLVLDVMTGGYDDLGKKICQLIVSRGDLEEALARVKPKVR